MGTHFHKLCNLGTRLCNHQSRPQTTNSVVDFVEVSVAQHFNCSRQATKASRSHTLVFLQNYTWLEGVHLETSKSRKKRCAYIRAGLIRRLAMR